MTAKGAKTPEDRELTWMQSLFPPPSPGPCWGAAQGGRIWVQLDAIPITPLVLFPPPADPRQPTLSLPQRHVRGPLRASLAVSPPQTSHVPP